MKNNTTKILSCLSSAITLVAYLIFLIYQVVYSDYSTSVVAYILLAAAFPFVGFSFIAVDFLPINKVIPIIAQILIIPVTAFGCFMAFATTELIALIVILLFIAFLVICILSIIGSASAQRDESATPKNLKFKITYIITILLLLAFFAILHTYLVRNLI